MNRNKPNHILIIPSWYPKNSTDIRGSFFRDQAIALAKNGFKVGVIYPQLRSLTDWRSLFNGQYGVDLGMDLQVRTLRYHSVYWIPIIKQVKMKLWVHYGLKLFNIYMAKYGKPDVIHVHSLLNGGILAKKIKELFGIPFVVTEHSTAYARDLLDKKQKKIAQKVTSDADRRLAVSATFARLLEKNLSKECGKWEELPNILSSNFANFNIVNRYDKDKFTFINISFLTEKKGIDNLLKAFEIAFKGNNEVRLSIGGEGKQRSYLENLTFSLGIDKQVTFLGLLKRHEVVDTIANSDAYVLASHYETFGVSVIEALALGKPVVATRCGGPESIVLEKDGYLVPPNNINALATAMEKLKNNYKNFDTEEIRKSCLARYGEKSVVAQLTEVYNEILQNR